MNEYKRYVALMDDGQKQFQHRYTCTMRANSKGNLDAARRSYYRKTGLWAKAICSYLDKES